MPRNLRKRRESSSSSSSEDEANKTTDTAAATADASSNISIKEKIEELKFLQKQRERTHGLDVYSLAIGDAAENAAKAAARRVESDPWKSKTGGLVDMREIREKRGNEIVRHMNANFAKETNQRDEDAEMQKFIEEQLKQIRGQGSKSSEAGDDEKGGASGDSGDAKKYKTPNDVIFDLPTYLLESGKKKQGDGFAEETLSGIPEVDLGIEERMRNIEETEKAKSTLLKAQAHAQPHTSGTSNRRNDFTSSVNFVQHKRFDETLINAEKQRAQQMAAAAAYNSKNAHLDEPVVGDAPKHELLQQRPMTTKRKEIGGRHGGGGGLGGSRDTANRPPKMSRPHTGGPNAPHQPTERASDDFCLERFKKNMKFSRSSKIRIA